jgi:hypothetical protein
MSQEMFYDTILNHINSTSKAMESVQSRLDKIPLNNLATHANRFKDIAMPDGTLAVDNAKNELLNLKTYTTSIENRIPLLKDTVNVVVEFNNKEHYHDIGKKQDMKDLTKIKLPFDNMFIESEINNFKMGIHIYFENNINKLKNIYSVDFYQEINGDKRNINDVMGYIDPKRIPRYYLLCQRFAKCKTFITPSHFEEQNKVLCQRTPRTSVACDYAALSMQLFPLLIYTLNRMNNPSVTEDLYAGIPQTAHERNNLAGGRRFIYIRPHKKIYVGDRTRNEVPSTHASPCEHERRGHIRRYKDAGGRVIKEVWINKATINKGGPKSDTKRVYKITAN